MIYNKIKFYSLSITICLLFTSFLNLSCKKKIIYKKDFLKSKIKYNANSLWCAKEYGVHFDSVRKRLSIPIIPNKAQIGALFLDGIHWHYYDEKDSLKIVNQIFYEDINRRFTFERTWVYLNKFETAIYILGSPSKDDSFRANLIKEYNPLDYFSAELMIDSFPEKNLTFIPTDSNNIQGVIYKQNQSKSIPLTKQQLDSIFKTLNLKTK